MAVSHSQITQTSHPISSRATIARESRCTFAANLDFQNPTRVFGVEAFEQPSVYAKAPINEDDLVKAWKNWVGRVRRINSSTELRNVLI